MIISFDVWSLAIFFVVAAGLIVSFLLYRSAEQDVSFLPAGALVLLFSISLFEAEIFWSGYYKNWPHLIGLSFAFPLLYGPLLLVYFMKKNATKVQCHYLIHFVPGFLLFAYMNIVYYWQPGLEKIQSLSTWFQTPVHGLIIPLLKILSLLIYAGYALFHFNQENRPTKLIITAFATYALLSIFYIVSSGLGILTSVDDKLIGLAQGFAVLIIGGIILGRSSIKPFTKIKYQTSTLNPALSAGLFKQVMKYMEKEKPYLQLGLRMPQMAKTLNLHPNELSQAINENTGKNFAEFISGYRLDEAEKLLPSMDNMSQLAIRSGFNNKTSFYEAFRKRHGTSPLQYKKLKSQDLALGTEQLN